MRYGITIVVVVFFAIIGTVVLLGSNNDKASTTKVARITKLVDYDAKDGASISYTTQGKLVGEDQRRAIRITITHTKRTVEVLDNYEERVSKSAEYTNSPAAFAAFVRALDNQSFGKERTSKQPDERGICPLGYRNVYRLTNNAKEVMRTWSDTCAVVDGPFGGTSANSQTIQRLFQAQITDYNKFVSGVQL